LSYGNFPFDSTITTKIGESNDEEHKEELGSYTFYITKVNERVKDQVNELIEKFYRKGLQIF